MKTDWRSHNVICIILSIILLLWPLPNKEKSGRRGGGNDVRTDCAKSPRQQRTVRLWTGPSRRAGGVSSSATADGTLDLGNYARSPARCRASAAAAVADLVRRTTTPPKRGLKTTPISVPSATYSFFSIQIFHFRTRRKTKKIQLLQKFYLQKYTQKCVCALHRMIKTEIYNFSINQTNKCKSTQTKTNLDNVIDTVLIYQKFKTKFKCIKTKFL